MSPSSFLGIPLIRDGLVEWVNLSAVQRISLSVDLEGKVSKVVVPGLGLTIVGAEEIRRVVRWINQHSGQWGISEDALP